MLIIWVVYGITYGKPVGGFIIRNTLSKYVVCKIVMLVVHTYKGI